jgi:hypothetical protein
MTDVPSVTMSLATAMSGAFNKIGESSISRIVAGVDRSAHNLIDGVAEPVSKNIASRRGFQYRNNGASGLQPVLTPQQLQVTRTSNDQRIMRIQQDSVNLLETASQLSGALNMKHPEFEEIGAVHLRLTMPVPTKTSVGGFQRIAIETPPPQDTSNSSATGIGKGNRKRSNKSATSSDRSGGRSNSEQGSCKSSTPRTKGWRALENEPNYKLTSASGFSEGFGAKWPDAPQPPPLIRAVGFPTNLKLERTTTIDPEPWHIGPRSSLASLGPQAKPWGKIPVRTEDPFMLGSERRDEPEFFSPVGSDSGYNLEDEISESIMGEASDWEFKESNPTMFTGSGPKLKPWGKVPVREPDHQPLGVLGNALRARTQLERMTGERQSPCARDEGCCHKKTTALIEWLGIGAARGYVSQIINLANCSGAQDLYVIDVILPSEVLTSCIEVADSLKGDLKPAKNLHIMKGIRKLKRVVSGQYDHPTMQYLETITNLTVMALLLDIGDTGQDHCHILQFSGVHQIFTDFFATQALEKSIEDLETAKIEAGHPTEGIVYSVPAPTIKGELNEVVKLYETSELEDYELTEVVPVVGAVSVGLDLMGKPAPNNHKHPMNYIGAVYRHLGEGSTTTGEGTDFEYVINLDRSKRSKLSPEMNQVWDDMTNRDVALFKEMLGSKEQRFDYDFFTDGKPNSYSTDGYERWLHEQLQDESFLTGDSALNDLLLNTQATSGHMQEIRAKAQVKKGEDADRARAVISPGVAGSEGLHQARCSPMIKALEALHAICYNHTNLKGMTEETKRIRFAEYHRAVPKGALVWGSDKKGQDGFFREATWKKCVTYLARMNDMFEECVTTRAYCYAPNEATADHAFPSGTLDMKYWIIKLTPLLSLLLSGIGPTSFFNRLESKVENGATVLAVFGTAGYEKWLSAEEKALESTHPKWSQHALPHVAEIVEWAPLAPRCVKDTSVSIDKLKDEDIITHHMGINEGDDQEHCLIPPQTPEWDLSRRDIITKYNGVMCRVTGFVFEVTLPADEEYLYGRNGIIEILSAWTGLSTGKADEYDVAVIVPKILKAIRKLPHVTLSSQHKLIFNEDEEPIDVERDANFWALALTKYYALAIMNHESLGVRGLFLAQGDYCYEQLVRLIGNRGAYSTSTIYGDRDPERKQLEEATCTTFPYCGEMKEHAHDLILSVRKDRVSRVCVCAWRTELPELATETKENVQASLYAFDQLTLSLVITEAHVADIMMYWSELSDIGCILAPLVRYATSNVKKVAGFFRSPTLLADNEQTVKLAREYAAAYKARADPTQSGGKGTRPDTQAGPKGKGKGKGKSKGKGKGKLEADAKGKGKGKPQADTKGKGKGKPNANCWKGDTSKGKGKLSPGQNATTDNWWRGDQTGFQVWY